MNNRYITGLGILAVFLVSASVVLTAKSQNRSNPKSGNGIELSEFRGYETWPMISVSQPDDADGCGSAPAPGCMKAIVGNTTMMKAYKEGIPANGKPVPDGAKLAKIEWKKSRDAASPYGVAVPGALVEVGFMVKDSKRFTQTNGWGYATFNYDTATGTFKAATNDPSVARNLCHGCHTVGVKQRDYVYTDYSKR
jgi:hypothetical protein